MMVKEARYGCKTLKLNGRKRCGDSASNGLLAPGQLSGLETGALRQRRLAGDSVEVEQSGGGSTHRQRAVDLAVYGVRNSMVMSSRVKSRQRQPDSSDSSRCSSRQEKLEALGDFSRDGGDPVT